MRFFTKNKSGMLLLDLTASLIIIGFLIWVFGGIIAPLAQGAKETALRYQLNNFRALVNLYKQLKGYYAEDLKILI
jgi:type II secretory pathway pseudopilin PulG